jgi:hexokinase
MEKKIAELTRPKYRFDLMLSEDGSGRGAALVAAVAVRQQKQLEQLRGK